MFEITIPGEELWDARRAEFTSTKAVTLRLEYSLVSLSKWESKWHIPFFDDSIEKTPEQMKAMIQEIVDGENKKKPYSDQAISDQLSAKGIKLSRRTVNKYRTEMGIPDKSGRKEF